MLDLGSISVSSTATIREVIGVIDRGAVQVALVTDADGRLLATVTDGDIRRGLLRGEGLEAPVERVMQRNFQSLPATATETEALTLMHRAALHQIPALDTERRVARLFILEHLIRPQSRPNTVVLMAGGKGERLMPMTEACPKPMLTVNGKPMLEIILDHCVQAGLSRFFIAVNYLGQQVKDHFGDGSRFGVDIRYVEESRPLGTAGALGLLPEIPEHPILLMNGDVLTRVNCAQLLQFHAERRADATLCVREHVTEIPYGVVQIVDSDVRILQEKPAFTHFVNAGIYVLNPEVLALLGRDEVCDMPGLLQRVMDDGRSVSAFPIHEYWVDVGQPDTLARARGEWE